MSGTRRTFWLLLLLASYAAHGQDRVGVPAEFAGKWVCQAPVPGYNLPMPVIPGQAPSTARMTTPPSTVVVTFTLREDGTYDAPNARGHYSFNAAAKAIDWLDGLDRQQFSKTELSRRSNGAPAMSLILNQQRYYGCFLAKEPGPKETPAAAPPGKQRYTKEEFLALGRQGAKAYNDGDLKKARAIFEDFVDADSSSSNAQSALGALLVRVGENDNALVHLSRAIELDPRELNAYVNRGEVYLRLGRRTEGEAD